MSQPAKSLVFSSRDPGFIQWTLLGFILVSAALHAFGFFVFQTIYPASAPIVPPPVQIGLLTPGTPEADAILRWIDSKDPYRIAQPARAPIPLLMSLPYTPSYATPHARPGMAANNEPPLPYPDGASGLDLVRIAAAHPATPPSQPAPAATTLTFSDSLQLDGPLPPLSKLHETNPGDQILPARFLLGVSDTGEVRYVFLQDTSLDQTLDGAAAGILEQVRFHTSASAFTWGFATFYWGSPVFAPLAASP